MPIFVITSDPDKLRQKILDDVAADQVASWTVDKDGDLTHTSPQWGGMAFWRMEVEEDDLKFVYVRADKPVKKGTKAA